MLAIVSGLLYLSNIVRSCRYEGRHANNSHYAPAQRRKPGGIPKRVRVRVCVYVSNTRQLLGGSFQGGRDEDTAHIQGSAAHPGDRS